MENFIINGKKIMIDDYKEFIFSIPVLFNAVDCLFHIEMNPDDVSGKPVVCFFVKSLKSGKKFLANFQIEGVHSKQYLFSLNDMLTEESLLISCSSTKNMSFLLSIIKKMKTNN
jgi:hypothetical protein